jgi:predicted amidophosphoribosyltransferase
MILENISYLRLCRIDELIRGQHFFLAPEDEVYFLREYTARAPFSHSDTNQWIYNFKKPLEKRETSAWRHKQQAILAAGSQLKMALFQSKGLSERLSHATLVPIPPSAAKDSPNYDDRMTQTLQILAEGMKLDIRELVFQAASQMPFHLGHNKREPKELRKIYRFDSNLASPCPKEIWIFDDILTTGSHFKAMQLVLKHHFPHIPILGFFLARTIGKGCAP